MDAKSIRGWLLCQPRPAKVRIVREDEQPQHIEITPGISYSSVAESIVALEPDLLEALDAGGNLIRAMRADQEPEEEETNAATEDGFVVRPDAGSAQLIIFAKLIADAYKTSTTVAFDKLGELFAMVVNREQAASQAAEGWQKAFLKQVMQRQAEQADGGDAPGGGSFDQFLMSQFMAGMQKAQAEKAVAAPSVTAPTNGVAKGEA